MHFKPTIIENHRLRAAFQTTIHMGEIGEPTRIRGFNSRRPAMTRLSHMGRERLQRFPWMAQGLARMEALAVKVSPQNMVKTSLLPKPKKSSKTPI